MTTQCAPSHVPPPFAPATVSALPSMSIVDNSAVAAKPHIAAAALLPPQPESDERNRHCHRRCRRQRSRGRRSRGRDEDDTCHDDDGADDDDDALPARSPSPAFEGDVAFRPSAVTAKLAKRLTRRARDRARRMRGRRLHSRSRTRSRSRGGARTRSGTRSPSTDYGRISTSSFYSTDKSDDSTTSASSASLEPSPVRGDECAELKVMKLRAIAEFRARNAAKAEARRVFHETMAAALGAAGSDPVLGLPELTHRAQLFRAGMVRKRGRNGKRTTTTTATTTATTKTTADSDISRLWSDTVTVSGVDVPSVLLRDTDGLHDPAVAKVRCEDDSNLACPRGTKCKHVHFRAVTVQGIGRLSAGWFSPTMALLDCAVRGECDDRAAPGILCRHYHGVDSFCPNGRLCTGLHRLDAALGQRIADAPTEGDQLTAASTAVAQTLAVAAPPASKRRDPWRDTVMVDGIAYPTALLSSDLGDAVRCAEGLQCPSPGYCGHVHFKPLTVKTLGVVSAGEFEPTDGLLHFTGKGKEKQAWLCRHFAEEDGCGNGRRCSFAHLRKSSLLAIKDQQDDGSCVPDVPEATPSKVAGNLKNGSLGSASQCCSLTPPSAPSVSVATISPAHQQDGITVDAFLYCPQLLEDTVGLLRALAVHPAARQELRRCPFGPHCVRGRDCDHAHFRTVTVTELGVMSAGDCEPTVGLDRAALSGAEASVCPLHGRRPGAPCTSGLLCSNIHLRGAVPSPPPPPLARATLPPTHVSPQPLTSQSFQDAAPSNGVILSAVAPPAHHIGHHHPLGELPPTQAVSQAPLKSPQERVPPRRGTYTHEPYRTV